MVFYLFVCLRERQNMKLGGGGIKEELVKGKDVIKIDYMKNVKSKIRLKTQEILEITNTVSEIKSISDRLIKRRRG